MLEKNVKIIEPTVVKEQNNYDIIRSKTRKRVCAYCRVSTGLEEQETSYKSQVEYYTKLINENENWTFVGIYADEGITGTSMKKRKEFLRMIDDAMDGKIDMILCKSISRFARNTVDCLTILERLKEKEIPVIFETEKLNSLDDERTTRLRITLESASAQEYSENLSYSVAWGKRRRVEQGYYALHKTYGYNIIKSNDKNVNSEYEINKDEAEIVKFIFESYINGYTGYQISAILNGRGLKSPYGKTWHQSSIRRILDNETYVGDLIYQKTISTDIKTRRRIKNTTQKKYLVENHHAPIIDRVTFERVKKEHEYRTTLRGYSKTGKSNYTSMYPFSNKLFCQECGSKLRRHYYNKGQKVKVYTWVCINHKENGKTACKQEQKKEIDIENAFVRVINKLIEDKDHFLKVVMDNVKEVIKDRINDNTVEQYDEKLRVLQRQITALISESVNDTTGKTFEQSQKVMAEMGRIRIERDNLIQEKERLGLSSVKIVDLEEFISENKVFNEFNGVAFRKLVEKVLIKDNEATFIFNDMIRLTEEIVK